MINLAIFVSGSGTNAENIISYFKGSKNVKIKLLLSNKADAFAIERARRLSVPSLVFSRDEFNNSSLVEDALENCDVDYVILAGFLLLVPAKLVERYRGKIINIHPALLPKFGGKGMYGENVHKAVVEAKEQVSGITIHQVNEQFDSGDTIFQAQVALTPQDTAEDVAAKIHILEQEYFPKVIEQYINSNL